MLRPHLCSLKVLEKKLAEVEREKQDLRGRMSTLQSQLAAGQREQQEALREKEEAVSQSKEVRVCCSKPLHGGDRYDSLEQSWLLVCNRYTDWRA